jgi:hypothetical protein
MTEPSLQFKDRGVKQQLNEPPFGVRVGHVYLNVNQQRIRFLNATARELQIEGVPFTPDELARQPLHTPAGDPVTVTDHPLVIATKTRQPAEAQFILRREKGSDWLLSWTATPLPDASGHVQGVLGSVTCGPAEPDTRQMAELAHDLRTPLQSLRLLCSLVEKMPQTDEELRKIMETIRAAADRAVQVALDLLECCRGPAPRAKKELPWFPLEPFLASLAEEQSVVALAKSLGLHTNFTGIQGWEMNTDRVRLGRVLANLLVNAVRYTPHGGVEFTTAWRDEADGRFLSIGVVDTGPGISSEEKESIFQPFERGRAGRDSDSGGSGLGLAVVDRLVEELGLRLEVYSEYGRGSAFHLLVPATQLRPGASK